VPETTRRLIIQGAAKLASAGIENSRLAAEAMLAAVCHTSRAAVISGLVEIDHPGRQRYSAMIARRMRQEPLAYIVGRKEFYSLEFEVTPAVLIPRPETETVVTEALEFLQDRIHTHVCDLGTGSGAIALAIAANAPTARLSATDVSDRALAIARRNAARFELESHVRFRLADCFEPLDGEGPLGRFALFVSNPPYIGDDEMSGLPAEIRCYEPHTALAGGPDGLDFYRRIALQMPAHLEPDGCAIMEVGAGKSSAVIEIMCNSGARSTRLIPDLAGIPRVVVANFNPSK